jgi:acid phosphatase type 7
MMKRLLLSAFLLLPALLFAQSALVRGPYLNVGTPESMVLRWRTTAAETGEVRFGTDANDLSFSFTEDAPTTEHEIRVTGLNPATVYHYTIGTNGNSYHAADGSYYFKTSPVPGSTDPIRMWVIGDFGNGSQGQRAVRDAYMNNFTSTHTDLWLWLGDNAYSDGTDEEYQTKTFEVYPEAMRNMVIWPCPGNHDYGSIDLSDNGPYYEILTMPRNGEAGGVPSDQERYFSFDYGNVHVVSLNTEYLLDIALPGTAFQQWLEADLAANDKDWVIAIFHQSPYSKGTHDSDDNFSRPQFFRQNVLPILENHGVDLVLTGHSHGYERSYLINGHFGKSDTWNPATMLVNGTNGNDNEGNAYIKYKQGESADRGTVYAVVGCSGQKGSGSSELNHPVMYMSTEDYHGSMVIDLEGDVLTARFIDTTGTTLDEFTIRKTDATSVGELTYDRSIYMNAYPNPFRENFTVEFRLEKEEEVTITVSDLSGRVVERVYRKRYSAGSHSIIMAPKGAVANAIYTVEMRTGDNLGAKRLVRVE